MASPYFIRFQVCALIASAFTMGASLAQESRQSPMEKSLTPALAKEALLQMIRSKAGLDLGWFKGNVADEMAKIGIKAEKEGWFAWTAAFRSHPAKAIYTLSVFPQPGVPACAFEYEGSFVRKGESWTATPPILARTVLPHGK